jgi:hypothetical protein
MSNFDWSTQDAWLSGAWLPGAWLSGAWLPGAWHQKPGSALTTWNPSDKDTGITLSNGNLTATGTPSGGDGMVRAVQSHSGSGKYYIEFTTGATYAGIDTGVGIATSAATGIGLGSNSANGFTVVGGTLWFNGASTGHGIGASGPGEVICMAVDLGAKLGWFRLNGGGWTGSGTLSGDPASGLNGLDISALFASNAAYPVFVGTNGSNSIVTANFGGSAFAQAVPSGYAHW